MPLAVEPEPAIIVEDAPDLPDEAITDTPTSELDPKDRLARWQRKLLDLSLRNGLLNFKQGKKALLLEVAAPALEDTLAEGQTIKLLPSPELMQGNDPRSQQLHEARSLEDLRKAHADDALKRREVFIRLEEQNWKAAWSSCTEALAMRCRKGEPTRLRSHWASWSGADPTSRTTESKRL
ncbi:MAG: DUF4011 domain-containing protein [Comamonadaceae bacterium]|nr:DUF4011 domain-containing protein [Comamonadaceae bacterium]